MEKSDGYLVSNFKSWANCIQNTAYVDTGLGSDSVHQGVAAVVYPCVEDLCLQEQ